MALAFLIGRIIVAIFFLHNAYGHLVKGGHMVGYAASKGVPAPKLAIMGSGLLLLLGGLSLITGIRPYCGLTLLLIFMIPVTFVMHQYWKETDPMNKMNEKISFLKNIAIIGFLLMSYAISEPWVYSF